MALACFDDAADVVQRLLRQTGIFVAREQAGAVLRQRHVAAYRNRYRRTSVLA